MTSRPRRILLGAALAAALALSASSPLDAVTSLPSADGQSWDIQDTSPWSQDSGSIATGGRAYPFNGFGYLKLRTGQAGRPPFNGYQVLRGFGLAYDGDERFDSITPLRIGSVVVARSIYAPKDADYLRYFDTFTNITNAPLAVAVAWGGATGAYADGGLVAVATTSSGDRIIDATDAFVTMMQNAKKVSDPLRGPSGHGPSAHVLGNGRGGVAEGAAVARFDGAGDMYANPFVDSYPGYDPAHVGYRFSLSIPAGQTVSLMTFVVKGLSEVYDPRGGYPIPIKDGLLTIGEAPVYSGPNPKIPAPGTEIGRVTTIARRLVAKPDVDGLTPRQLAQIGNWSAASLGLKAPAPPAFTVFEKPISELQDAMTRGVATSEDIVREYLTRLAAYDRSGPAYRAMLSLNPRAIADARARDAERAAGTVRGPFHGVPVAYKDNIDAVELPTTGGSRALADRRPRLDSAVARGMKRAGAVVIGKANLDEFPFGDFGISTVGGTIGNAFDPTLSTAGSSGGSATLVSASMAALAFGTDTCNSLSNPAGFASLATIRTTRGLTSRAGVMPLNPYNDAVGPMGRSIRDIALALDMVTGEDPEDSATEDANEHKPASFAAGLSTATLKGARIGVLRQRFVGFTGETEVAGVMDRALADMRRAGATLVDVSIPDYDEKYTRARGTAPGALRAAWIAYLTRGLKPGEEPITIESLLESGKLAPVSAARFRSALAPMPDGADFERATREFYERREAFRQIFLDLMDAQKLDAIVYPANQARPHTHEGGLIRYGSEPGTCEESAATGLPQVTVPAGFMANRYPVGMSLLGRMWADQKLLELAAAYERLTHHRRAPGR